MTSPPATEASHGTELPVSCPAGISLRTFERLRPYWHRLGQMADEEMSRVSGVSRGTVWGLRRRLGIPVYSRVAPEVPAALKAQVRARILAREKLKGIARDMRISWLALRAFATEVGYDPAWKRVHMTPPSKTVGCMTKMDVLRRFDAGETLDSIAKRAGVSRERIRQVAEKAGRHARQAGRHRTAVRRRAKIRAAIERRQAQLPAKMKRTAERRRKKEVRFLTVARKLWRRGQTIRAIAQVYGLTTNSMGWWIYVGRKHLRWFPHRQAQRKSVSP